ISFGAMSFTLFSPPQYVTEESTEGGRWATAAKRPGQQAWNAHGDTKNRDGGISLFPSHATHDVQPQQCGWQASKKGYQHSEQTAGARAFPIGRGCSVFHCLLGVD